jgi:hypothetical protein
MNDVIECAARVLFDADAERFRRSPSGFLGAPSWEHANEEKREPFRAYARSLAAVGLLAEPSDALKTRTRTES